MTVLVFVLLGVTIVASEILQALMFVRNEPWYGMVAIMTILGPGALLTFSYVALTYL